MNIYKRIKYKFLRSGILNMYFKISAKFWITKSQLSTAAWFFKRAVYAMLGREGIVNSREVYSKGGYKYYQINITKFPFNKNALY